MAKQVSARSLAIVVALVLVALIALLALADTGDSDEVTNLLGGRSPEVAGLTIDGQNYDIDDYRGSWVVVNFFATWCPGCVNEHPELLELEAWAGQRSDVEMVAIVFNDPVERVEQFFFERGGDWPVLNNPAVPVEFQVAQIPETFLVSPTGQVVLHVPGEVSADQLIEFIESKA